MSDDESQELVEVANLGTLKAPQRGTPFRYPEETLFEPPKIISNEQIILNNEDMSQTPFKAAGIPFNSNTPFTPSSMQNIIAHPI